jgi:hypothetical protein
MQRWNISRYLYLRCRCGIFGGVETWYAEVEYLEESVPWDA